MSTRTRPTTERDDLFRVVRHLSTIRPHDDGGDLLTAAEFAIYWRGYYRAILAALASMELALRQRTRRRQEVRRQEEARRDRTLPLPRARRHSRRQAPMAARHSRYRDAARRQRSQDDDR